MSDEMSRALGTGGSTVVVAGKECQVRPLGVGELADVERECLRQYRESYIDTYANARKHLGKKGDALLLQKIEEAGHWDINDLPLKYAFDEDTVVTTKALEEWVSEKFGVEMPVGERKIKRLTATALDQKMLSEAECVKLAGAVPVKTSVGYVNWWITGCFEGMITFIWMCFKTNGVTKKQVLEELRDKPDLLSSLSREIEHLSAPVAKNG